MFDVHKALRGIRVLLFVQSACDELVIAHPVYVAPPGLPLTGPDSLS